MFGRTAIAIDRSTGTYRTPVASAHEAIGAQLKLPKHRSIYLAGDDADRLFEVESGAVMLYRILDDGRRQVVEVVFPGGVLGLTAGETHQTCAETLVASILRSFRKTEIARSDALRGRVAEKLQAQITQLHDHTVSLGRKTAEERICTLILRLRELNQTIDNAAQGAVALPMTRTEMADYLGLTLETVCRTLSDLSRRKLVEVGQKKSEIRVPDVAKLRRAACCDAAA